MKKIYSKYILIALIAITFIPASMNAQCITVEDFESGSWVWSPWTAVTGTGGVGTISGVAHGGSRSIDYAQWHYRTDLTIGNAGDTLSCWCYFTGSGRCYMGFSNDASGGFSAVMAPNTGTIIIQRNASYGYADQISTPHSWTYNRWYKSEIVWNTSSNVTYNLYDDSEALINSIVGYNNALIVPGGVALRVFSTGNRMDDYYIGACSSILPTQIIDYKADLKNSQIAISWISTSEISNTEFKVEKRVNGEDFEVLEIIPGKGGENQSYTYEINDPNPKPGENIYRLSQINANGGVQVFGTTSVNVTEDLGALITMSPNPASDILSVTVPASLLGNGNIGIRIQDMLGKTVLSENVSQLSTDINISSFDHGMYLVSFHDQTGLIKTKKLLVQ